MAALHFLPQLQKCNIQVAVMDSGFDERCRLLIHINLKLIDCGVIPS